MINRTYTDDELIRRVTDVEEIKKLANKRTYYKINEERDEELDRLWVSEPENMSTASFGKNTGFYVGMDAIRAYYVDKRAADFAARLAEISAADPSIKNTPENIGLGCMNAHPISTGLVHLAGDGKTARGLWYCIGQETQRLADGTALALWQTGKVAIDFIREPDGWKIWHLAEASDCVCEAGADYGDGMPNVDLETDPVAAEFGVPTIPALTHDQNFNWWDDYPAMPQPYDTFDPADSYGPEGFKPAANKGFSFAEGRNYL